MQKVGAEGGGGIRVKTKVGAVKGCSETIISSFPLCRPDVSSSSPSSSLSSLLSGNWGEPNPSI